MSIHGFVFRGIEQLPSAATGGAGQMSGVGWAGRMVCSLAFLVVCFACARMGFAQVVAGGDVGGATISAGATASGYYVQYGDQKMVGVSAFVDADTRRRIGLEVEGRWLEFHEMANVHTETYTIGPRYHLTFGRFQPYVKGLVGFSEFNFPYNYAHGSYLVLAPGGGLDFRLTHRIRIRAADFEYQYWPQFTYGAMTSYGVSTGLKILIF